MSKFDPNSWPKEAKGVGVLDALVVPSVTGALLKMQNRQLSVYRTIHLECMS